MKSIKAAAIILFLSYSLLMGAPQAAGEAFNRVVAIVNDKVITLHELNRKIKEVTGADAADLRFQNENKYLEMRRKVLESLVDEKITQNKIQELNIKVTQKQIDAAIERIKANNQLTHEDLLANLEKEGMPYETFRENIKKEIERIQLINSEVKSKIIITEEKIKAYYLEHRSEFSSDAKVHIAGIFLARRNPGDEREAREIHKKGEEILDKLKKGADFGDLVTQYSEGPGSREGGDLGTFRTAELEPELRKICESLPEGGFSDLIVRPNGIQIITLLTKEEGRVKSLEESRNAIHSILYRDEVDKRYLSWIKGLREGSYTKIIF
ncbi:MAG: SurA N-terminal domain-containing protein [Pseudomonadota bacterium]